MQFLRTFMSLQLGVREDNVIVPLLQNVVLGSNQNVSAEGCLLSLGFFITLFFCITSSVIFSSGPPKKREPCLIFFINTCARVCVGAHVQQKQCTNTAYLCKKLAAKSTKKFFRRRFCTIILQLECILLAESAYRKLNESIKKSKEMSKRSKLVTRS